VHVQRGGGLHVEDLGILSGVRHLEHGHRAPGGQHQERLVPLAAEVPRVIRSNPEQLTEQRRGNNRRQPRPAGLHGSFHHHTESDPPASDAGLKCQPVTRMRLSSANSSSPWCLRRSSRLVGVVSRLALFLVPEFSQAMEKPFHHRPDRSFVCGPHWDTQIVYLKTREHSENQFCVSLRVRRRKCGEPFLEVS
jgi:hypothetical protein